jgi:hypothetical protein
VLTLLRESVWPAAEVPGLLWVLFELCLELVLEDAGRHPDTHVHEGSSLIRSSGFPADGAGPQRGSIVFADT